MSAAYLVQRQAAAATTTAADATATDYDGYVYGYGYGDDRLVPFWYTRTGLIVKWVVFLSLLLFFTLWVTLGYMHAKKRMQKGLVPLAYHRWLVPRAQLARVDPRYAYPPPQPNPNPNYYRPGYQAQYDPSYNMQNMPPPPPMYDPSAPRPPTYEGPEGGSKMAPSQEYEAPPGPPPPAPAPAPGQQQPVGRNDTGSSNPFRL